MRRPAVFLGFVVSVLLAAQWLPGSARAQQTYSAGQWNWAPITQAECEQRARQALAAAAARFGLPFQVQSQDGWLFGDTVGHTSAYVACVADDDTPRIVSSAARRVLVVVDVDSVRREITGQLRDFLRQCVHDGACGDVTAGPSPGTSPGTPPGTPGATAPAGTFLGCYADKGGDRDLPDFTRLESTNSAQACIRTCADKGFIYAGTQYGRECACGDTYGKHGRTTACDYPCSGNPREICGGYYANSIYATGVSPAATRQLPPDTPFRQLSAPGGTYLGCFADKNGDRDLPHFTQLDSTNSAQACIGVCRDKGHVYAGTQYGRECACGDTYGKHGASNACDYACTGAAGEICGGYYANSVYATGLRRRN